MADTNETKIFTGFSLKIIAIAAMAVDHVGAVIFPDAFWMRGIGRITFPVMAFLISEGFFHTRNPKRYILRLAAFGVLSQLPYYFMFRGITPVGGNVMFTLACSAGVLYLIEAEMNSPKKFALIVGACAIAAICDWSVYGLFCVVLLYATRENRAGQMVCLVALVLLMVCAVYISGGGYYSLIHLGMLLAVPLIYMYNGKRGEDMRWLFYAFYPAHMAIIAVLRNFL